MLLNLTHKIELSDHEYKNDQSIVFIINFLFISMFLLSKEMCQLARLDYEEEVKRNKQIHDAIAAERARKKYEKHYGICREVHYV